jgi:NADH-quinone oxidoreductase subunit L
MQLMGVSVLVGFLGIGVAYFFFLRKPEAADAMASRFSPIHRLLLGKYYVDEIYDATVVQPIKRASSGLLWRGVDAGLIDGTVNGVGLVVRGWSARTRCRCLSASS